MVYCGSLWPVAVWAALASRGPLWAWRGVVALCGFYIVGILRAFVSQVADAWGVAGTLFGEFLGTLGESALSTLQDLLLPLLEGEECC